MIAVCDQCGTFDLTSDADTENGNHLVADKTDDTGNTDPKKLRDRLRVDQAVDRLVSGDPGTKEYDQPRNTAL